MTLYYVSHGALTVIHGELFQGSFEVALKDTQTLHVGICGGLLKILGDERMTAIPEYQGGEAIVGQHTRRANAAKTLFDSLHQRHKPIALKCDVSRTKRNGQDLNVCGNQAFEDVLPHTHIL
jgi:hypothetical protein